MMLFPSWKSDELFDFSLGWPSRNLKCGAAFWAGCSESHVPCGSRRRELTPVRLCSVRLSWRQRARPSTTLHEIQICRSRLEYIVCNTGLRLWQLAEIHSTQAGTPQADLGTIALTPSAHATGSNSVRTISSGQSVRFATRQLNTNT